MCIGPVSVISMHDGIFEKKIVSHNASILPSFQYLNALICNILIFGVIFDYDFLQFWLIYGLRVLQRSQNRRIRLYSNVWNLWASGGCAPGPPPGALPQDPTRGPTAGPWTPRWGYAHFARYALTFLAPPLQKTFRGPCQRHPYPWAISVKSEGLISLFSHSWGPSNTL